MGQAIERHGCVIYLDGDDVGSRIELHLLRGDIGAAAAVSAAVVRAVDELADELRGRFGGRVVFAAGDEVLAVLPRVPDANEIERLRELFQKNADLSISCGIGASAQEAVVNLRMAKLLGKDRAHPLFAP